MLRWVVASALFVVVLAEPILAQSALDRVRASGRLRVGIDATYPPFGIAEGGEFSGFDVDIARAIARQLGVEAEIVNASFDGVFPALQNGAFDVVISAVTITPERCATLLFSDPYIDAGQQIVVRGDSAITGPDTLMGRTVGVQIYGKWFGRAPTGELPHPRRARSTPPSSDARGPSSFEAFG
jgi:ABC-type amino acid transport substrate-binding protein